MKPETKKIWKRIMAVVGIVLFLVIAILVYASWKVPHDTDAFVFDDVGDVPPCKVALVLGASKNLANGQSNPYFDYRIRAAKELYEAGKVKAFVVSGDNRRHSYNEPEDMRQALMKEGIPDSVIYLDYAGLRTLDSVIRMHKIFGQSSFIVVSQKFHNQRAVFLAQDNGLTAYGYNAEDVALGRFSFKTKIREKFALVKALVDIVLNKQPKHLGEPVHIE
ncbi:vancomycin high temperature exclusion protein [Dysgonomonas sp. 520]|uniref:SanA/YdcF family protein n=1 Tax=Dysgonomonas sp. 520 TaxID=2302931 RepID=UPI0013D2D4A6|nr:ElyC/SanA/YdcF family protein [Dysgonomonas sp. 520]NDW08203.1 hypothetical protein [Dysgonomonas sp. 520]